MADTPLRNLGLRRLSTAGMVLFILAGLIMLIPGIASLATSPNQVGILLAAGGLALIAAGLIIQAVVQLVLKLEGNLNRLHLNSLDSYEVLRRMAPRVESISENLEISDQARSITHREKEREAVRNAIREEMYSGDWEAAHYLIDEMERRFGYKQEAQQLRSELAQVREMTIEEKIGEAVGQIEKLMSEYRWKRASVEIERLLKLFPRHERITRLPQRLTESRAQHKQELLRQWQGAVARNAIDEGVAILTTLDQYLTAEEAGTLRESARHVFKEHLLNLGVQFSLAVTENRWRDALEIGLRIRQEFPNSRMSEEVGDKLEVLRVKAGIVRDADVIQRTNP